MRRRSSLPSEGFAIGLPGNALVDHTPARLLGPVEIRINDEAAQKALEHHVHPSSPKLLIPSDDRLHRLLSYGVVRDEFEGEPINIANAKASAMRCLSNRRWYRPHIFYRFAALLCCAPSFLLCGANSCWSSHS